MKLVDNLLFEINENGYCIFIAQGGNCLKAFLTFYFDPDLFFSKAMVFNLSVVTPLETKQPFHRGQIPDILHIPNIYITT